jgi:hypothetical protein
MITLNAALRTDFGGNKHIRNVDQFLPVYTTQQPNSQPSSAVTITSFNNSTLTMGSYKEATKRFALRLMMKKTRDYVF